LQQLTTKWFQHVLEQLPQTQHYWIAYSGGLDSRVLLQLCSDLQSINSNYRFSAIHVNHQLQPKANQWAQCCASTCAELDIECIVKAVNAQPLKGKSPEQAARDARRAAFSQAMNDGDVLLTAHHLNDQAETLLLRLFRGAGVTGLAGIRPSVQFSRGWMVRPLLDVARANIQQFAQHKALQWIEDPSNQCQDYDRNFLRQAIIPQLQQRWPGLQATLARNASICLDADIALQTIARQALAHSLTDHDTLLISKLMTFDATMQNLVLREWFADHQLNMPSFKLLQRIKQDVIAARIDRIPKLTWLNEGEQCQLRRYRDQLYLLQNQPAFDTSVIIKWNGINTIQLPANLDDLQAIQSPTGGISERLWTQSEITIRFRQGGETCLLPGRQGHRSLKSIFQEANIPPWQRNRIPLIYLNNELAAIGELFVCAAFYVGAEQSAVLIKPA
jgi:tRNA(Ile)-lysidine synthase